MLIGGGIAVVALAVALRLLPALRSVRGVDAWFYLLHAAALRQQRRLPTRLSEYLLADEEQRYPPAFPVVLSLFPTAVLERTQPWIAATLDSLHLVLLLWTARTLGLDPSATLLAGLAYATTPDLAHEYGTLSSRAWASLLVTLVALTALRADEPAVFAFNAALVALLLLSHKLAAQQLLLLLPALAIERGTPAPVVAGVLGFGVALLSGFYARVLRAHRDVLRYWHAHVALRGAHPVYDSPLYAAQAPPDWRSYRLYTPGVAGAARLLRGLVARNPWVLLGLPAAALAQGNGARFLLTWAAAVYLMALATLLVPPLRFLGEGFRYLKFGAFPVALLVGQAFGSSNALPLVAIVLALSLFVTFRLLALRPLEVIDPAFAEVLAFLGQDPRERVAVLPTHRADAIAWHTRKKVLWGGHSSGYERLADLVPVLRRPLVDLLDDYGIGLLLLDREYVRPEALGLADGWRELWEFGRYAVFERRIFASSR